MPAAATMSMNAPALSNGDLVRRLFGLAWRYRLHCLRVLAVQIVLLTMGISGLSLTGVGIDYIKHRMDGTPLADNVLHLHLPETWPYWQVLGLLASTASDDDSAVRSLLDSYSQEAVLNVPQMRIYMVPVLEYLLATDPLGVAFDLLTSGTRDTVRALPFLPLFPPFLPASDTHRLT